MRRVAIPLEGDTLFSLWSLAQYAPFPRLTGLPVCALLASVGAVAPGLACSLVGLYRLVARLALAHVTPSESVTLFILQQGALFGQQYHAAACCFTGLVLRAVL